MSSNEINILSLEHPFNIRENNKIALKFYEQKIFSDDITDLELQHMRERYHEELVYRKHEETIVLSQALSHGMDAKSLYYSSTYIDTYSTISTSTILQLPKEPVKDTRFKLIEKEIKK